MAPEPAETAAEKVWLVMRSGNQIGPRYLIVKETTRIGRALENEVVLQGPEAASVSLRHCEIRREPGGFRLRDLESTNGTYLDGQRITEAALHAPAVIRLGTQGPEVAFVSGEGEESRPELNSTQVIDAAILPSDPAAPERAQEQPVEALLTGAVEQARRAREHGFANQTMGIMRDVVHLALRQTRSRSRKWIAALATVLVAVSGFAAWKVTQLNQDRRALDARIQAVEARLQKTENSAETDRLLSELDEYQGQAERLRRSLLYRVGVREQDFVTEEIRTLMAEFGSETYSVPPDFTERVQHYIEQYQGPDRAHMERALGESARQIHTIRSVLEEEHLPPDLAYVPVVESTLATGTSKAGASGYWQFTSATAKAYGLRVDAQVDERTNVVKSTHAACRYLRDLILDFGNGSSVMLALAAYNLGPSRVKQAVKTVEDPIRQRNFWYLYRTRSLPSETREYVPKVVSAMIVGRNARRFGF